MAAMCATAVNEQHVACKTGYQTGMSEQFLSKDPVQKTAPISRSLCEVT